jgi:hypothetical protein
LSDISIGFDARAIKKGPSYAPGLDVREDF